MTGKKIGRPPSKEPKEAQYTVRLTADLQATLKRFCESEGISYAEGLREGVRRLATKN